MRLQGPGGNNHFAMDGKMVDASISLIINA
jgi:hypothetical protein